MAPVEDGTTSVTLHDGRVIQLRQIADGLWNAYDGDTRIAIIAHLDGHQWRVSAYGQHGRTISLPDAGITAVTQTALAP
ncbi:hypothetical protein ACFVH6_21635 [Spirillospora sp. NPDC127200]